MLSINGLDVFYGKTQVLREISLNIHEGELVTIVGNNGAGKTTLMMTLSGIIQPTAGTIDFLGIQINKLPPHERLELGLVQVPQGRMLFPNMTVQENLELGTLRAKDKRKIRERLDEVYSYFEILVKRRRQKAGTLSGGEQEMLTIARGLMADPKLLMLDEPSAGLAPILVQHLLEIILELNKQGLTVLLVEQNSQLALEIASRAYILEIGSIVTSGKASELLQSTLVKESYLGLT